MLTLTRKAGQRIFIDDIIVEIVRAKDGKAVVGITAPASVKVLREELAIGMEPRPLDDGIQLRSPEG